MGRTSVFLIILSAVAFLKIKNETIRTLLGDTKTILENKAFLNETPPGYIQNQQFSETKKNMKTLTKMSDWQRYKLLCLGEISVPADIQKQLKCRYVDQGHFSLKIAPFKEEEAYLEPRIVLYHDVIYDQEINIIKKLAQPKFQKATFKNEKTGKIEFEDFRITDTAWLADSEHKNVEAVSRRVKYMTNLTVNTAEILQVAYYEIGGKYDPHYDFFTKDSTHLNDFMRLGMGNRIATVLFYLSNVEQGGATVFPKINVSLWPRKGSAAFWYNLKPNGVGDFLTLHAACPVISGSKWAANKWIHEVEQEFRRPCTLENQPEDNR